jgi:hypothetical protein
VLSETVLAVRLSGPEETYLLLCSLTGNGQGKLNSEVCAGDWRPVLSTNETRFGGHGETAFNPSDRSISFAEPELLLLVAN